MSSLESASTPVLASTATHAIPAACPDTIERGKIAAFVELTKPRIVVMVLLTVAVGYVMGSRGATHPLGFLLTLIGTGLVAAGASVWNQVIERDRDALMRRTRLRPLPAGRVSVAESLLFGTILAILGLILLCFAPHRLGAVVAGATFLLYVFAYTPLKPKTTLNTAIGAIPGALPPVIGWTAATGRFGIESLALFLVVFLWQFPHFLAIAWVHRDDYARGGMRMLPLLDATGHLTGRQSTLYALALVPAGLLPSVVGLAGAWYFVGALVLGLYYVMAAARFWKEATTSAARKLMGASFLYLPAILLLLIADPMPR